MADGVCIAHKDGVGLCRNGFPQKPFCRGQVGCLSCGNISAREIPSCLDDDFAPAHLVAAVNALPTLLDALTTSRDRERELEAALERIRDLTHQYMGETKVLKIGEAYERCKDHAGEVKKIARNALSSKDQEA